MSVVGAVIGNYKIVRKLGEGGMGAVYLGEHSLLGRKAAVKVLLPTLSARADIVNRFFNEARAATSINDPGIVQIFDFGYHTDGSAFIVMEFLEGETLDARLHRLGRLVVSDALRLIRQVSSSLYAAHQQGIVHRDLKPENIFIVRDPEMAYGERPKILDFGIAKLSDDHPGKIKTHTGALMGTPVYMSPEQCRGSGDLDHRSDIYALGCVLFHLLVGRPPFDSDGMGEILASHLREPAPPPSSRAPGIPAEADAIVLHCMEKDPAARFQDMNELSQAIGQLLPYVTAPGSPGSHPPAYQAGATPLPGWATRPSSAGGTPMHGSRPPATPTTLGTSNGQVAGTAPPPRGRAGWVLALALAAGGGGAAIAVAMSRGGHTQAVAQPTEPPVKPAAPDAAPIAVTPPDANVAPLVVLDAAPPPPSPADAAPPPDAAKHVPSSTDHHHHHGGGPGTGSGTGATPGSGTGSAPNGGCDRSVDEDCDGIPDHR